MNNMCLVINVEELSYSVHVRCCSQLLESASGRIVEIGEPGNDEDVTHAPNALLPSWDFRPCDCLREDAAPSH